MPEQANSRTRDQLEERSALWSLTCRKECLTCLVLKVAALVRVDDHWMEEGLVSHPFARDVADGVGP